jgi:hypothetical protein
VRERCLGDDVVGEPVCELGERVRGQRRDDEEVGTGEMEVEVVRGRAPREREERLGPNEPLRSARDERDHLVAALDEQPHQLARLVGGNPTGHADEHPGHARNSARLEAAPTAAEATSSTCT